MLCFDTPRLLEMLQHHRARDALPKVNKAVSMLTQIPRKGDF